MKCIWNVAPYERQCQFCVVQGCEDRFPQQPDSWTVTRDLSIFESYPSKIVFNPDTGEILYTGR